jgi:hypothetical protein
VIGDLSDQISANADKIIIAHPKIEEAVQIKSESEKIKNINEENIKNTEVLGLVKEDLVKASITIKQLKEKVEQRDETLSKGIDKILLMAYALCFLGIVAGVILIGFSQHKNGIILVGSSITILGLIYFLQAYAWVLGIVAGIFFVGLIVTFGLKVIKDQRIKKELVLSYEKIKSATQYTDTEKKNVLNIQSENTINEVSAIKKDLGIN